MAIKTRYFKNSYQERDEHEKNILKKARAGFISGAVFCAISSCFYPMHISWIMMALISGFVAGYLGYDFQEVLRKIPVAWRQTRFIIAQKNSIYSEKFYKWLSTEHPVFYSRLLFGALGFYVMQLMIHIPCDTMLKSAFLFIIDFGLGIAMGLAFSILFVQIYNEVEDNFFITDDAEHNKEQERYYTGIEMSYKNLFCALMAGFGYILLLIFCLIARPFYNLFCVLIIFLKKLIISINSHERACCSIIGLIGGIISAKFFAPQPFGLPQYWLGIFCGGMLGAGLVIFCNLVFYKLVAKWEAKDNKATA